MQMDHGVDCRLALVINVCEMTADLQNVLQLLQVICYVHAVIINRRYLLTTNPKCIVIQRVVHRFQIYIPKYIASVVRSYKFRTRSAVDAAATI